MLSKEASPRTGFSAETGLPSTHLLSLLVIIGLMAQGDLLSLLSGQGLPVAVLTKHGGVYDILLSATLQPGQQAEDVLQPLHRLGRHGVEDVGLLLHQGGHHAGGFLLLLQSI